MAISGVNPKCYILALFVRDDGTRFLLGDDPFEFKDNQLHFQQNTMANDVVEVQGNDGYLLAGQVRRPGTQMFDGYVCNGTNSKEEVEAKRREFLQFFRRSHFYKVIYVFPNGTAIQRKQGFLVDDPTVQELYQQYPEYHVALNFEDVNYYTYEEDEQGHEIYAKEAIIKLAGGGATGGLIWDNYGVVWENPWSDIVTISGIDFQVDNLLPVRVPIQDTQLKGDTYQQTYSGKNLLPILDGTISNNGLTITVQDGEMTIDGTTTTGTMTKLSNGFISINGGAIDSQWLSETTPISNLNGKTISIKYISGTAPSSAWAFRVFTNTSAYNNQWRTGTSDTQYTWSSDTGTVSCFTLYVNGGYTFTNYKVKIQIETGSSPTSYEPYTGGIPAPNPDYPQDIQVVTGAQTVTIGDGDTSQTYPISLGSIELCKLGTYQDYIYKSGDDWYVHKAVGKVVLDGSNDETWNTSSLCYYVTLADKTKSPYGMCDHFIYSPDGFSTSNTAYRGYCTGNKNDTGLYFMPLDASQSSVALFKTWLSTNPTTAYYILATPTDTKITDATLVGQLEALDAMRLFIGENNVLVSTPTPNLPATLQFDYYTKYQTLSGAEWEEGGTKGATIVDVDAIDNTYPVWELIGPAINPIISVLTTNTTLTYNGTITASQKLVIDMFNKTATLNGTSVIGNVTGDFVYMAPGTNRVAYTAGNADAPDSTIYWQEVVG